MEFWNLIVLLAGLLATPVLCVSYIPQIIKFYKYKKADDVSTSFWYILDFSLLMLFILAVEGYMATGALGLVIAQALNLVLALIVTGQVIYYKQKS